MKKFLIFLVLCFSIVSAYSSELILGGWSYHEDRTKDYNETHYNAGIVQGDYVALWYKNSNSNNSLVIGRKYDLLGNEHVKVGALTMLVSGYSYSGEVLPAVLPYLSLDYDRVGIDFHILPTLVYQMQLRFKLDKDLMAGKSLDGLGKNLALTYGAGLNGYTIGGVYRYDEDTHIRLYNSRGHTRWYDYWYSDRPLRLVQRETIFANMTGIVVDQYVWKELALYGGVVYNANKYVTRYSGTSNGADYGEVNILHQPISMYTGDSLIGVVTWDSLSYALGIRWGNPFKLDEGDHWGWYVDLGVTSMSGISGKATPSISGLSDEEQDRLDGLVTDWVKHEEDKYDKYRVVPKLEFGVTYKF